MQAIIFDMDGLLIDSEPFWNQAEKRVFSTLGIDITDALSNQTKGMTTRQATEFWLQYAAIPADVRVMEALEKDVLDEVAALIESHGQAMPGVHDLLRILKQENFKIALATNAPTCIVPVVLDKLNIARFFDDYVTADDVQHGKPHPAIYQLALTRLAVSANKTIVFEDSVTGMSAAKSANITTVVVPSTHAFDHPGFADADLKVKSLADVSLSQLSTLLDTGT